MLIAPAQISRFVTFACMFVSIASIYPPTSSSAQQIHTHEDLIANLKEISKSSSGEFVWDLASSRTIEPSTFYFEENSLSLQIKNVGDGSAAFNPSDLSQSSINETKVNEITVSSDSDCFNKLVPKNERCSLRFIFSPESIGQKEMSFRLRQIRKKKYVGTRFKITLRGFKPASKPSLPDNVTSIGGKCPRDDGLSEVLLPSNFSTSSTEEHEFLAKTATCEWISIRPSVMMCRKNAGSSLPGKLKTYSTSFESGTWNEILRTNHSVDPKLVCENNVIKWISFRQ